MSLAGTLRSAELRGFDALRALLGYEYSIGAWFSVVPYVEPRPGRDARPFGGGKIRPVILATPRGPDAVLYPRSTQPSRFRHDADRFWHDAHRHDPPDPCSIDRPGWVILAERVTVEPDRLNDKSYSCEEPEDSPLLAAVREALRP